jgi:hypothetical protein
MNRREGSEYKGIAPRYIPPGVVFAVRNARDISCDYDVPVDIDKLVSHDVKPVEHAEQ